MGVEIDPQEAKRRAETCFRSGLPCTQSLLLAFDDVLAVDRTTLRAAVALGRGLGGTGAMCGALATGILALGLLRAAEGDDDVATAPGLPRPQHDWLDYYVPGASDEELFSRCRQFAEELAQELQYRFGSLSCREISGVDWDSRADIVRYYGPGGSFHTCAEIVGLAAERLAGAMHDEARPS